MSDELRNRIRRLDPMDPDVETRSVSESREMMEAVMSTPTKSTNHRPERDRQTLRPAAGSAGGSIAISRPARSPMKTHVVLIGILDCILKT